MIEELARNFALIFRVAACARYRLGLRPLAVTAEQISFPNAT